MTPRHVAVIMDGNGRWAEKRGYPRVFGHVRGARRVKEIVREAKTQGVQALTLYAFSTENWSRPEAEIRVLWRLLKKYLVRETDELARENVRLRVIGEIERLSSDVRAVLDPAIERLSGNTGMVLTFAFSYGGRREIADAARLMAQDAAAGKLTLPAGAADEGLEKLFASYLWMPANVDLLIRTSGEYRISNFLLWQSAYAELLFVDRGWPDFGAEDFRQAIMEYSRRNRRFGAVGLRTDIAATEQPETTAWISP